MAAQPALAPVARPERLRVAWLAIASGGAAYDAMKTVMREHLESARPALDVHGEFVYGHGTETRAPTDLDRVYDVQESLIPGILDKTVHAFKAHLAGTINCPEVDYVVRTNVSTWFHWDKLAEFLRTAPRTGFAAGYSPDQTHLCGNCIVLSPDVARKLADYRDYEYIIDDLAIAKALQRMGVRFSWIPRIDILENGVVGHGASLGLVPRNSFQYRVKGCVGTDGPRMRDPAIMANLTRAYRRGVRDTDSLLHAAVDRIETLVPVEPPCP